MFFTTKQVADTFGKSDSWVYNKSKEIGIVPKKVPSTSAINGVMNQYSAKDIELLWHHIKKMKDVVVIEVHHWIIESKGNHVEIQYLPKEKWEK